MWRGLTVGSLCSTRAQVVGWPPVRRQSYRKNTLTASATKTKAEDESRSEAGCCYVKISMDGAPYLRKVDLKTYSSYEDLSLGLEKMFSCFITGKCFCFLLVLLPQLSIYFFTNHYVVMDTCYSDVMSLCVTSTCTSTIRSYVFY